VLTGSALQRGAVGQVTCESSVRRGGGRRVKQPRPRRSAPRDDASFRGVICRFVMSFDGRQTRLNISTEFKQVFFSSSDSNQLNSAICCVNSLCNTLCNEFTIDIKSTYDTLWNASAEKKLKVYVKMLYSLLHDLL